MKDLILTGTAVTLLLGAVVLLVIMTVKKKRRAKEPELKVNPADVYPALEKRPVCHKEQKNIEIHEEDQRHRERTVMLTYTTLILKDKDHPLRNYKADLFQAVYIGRDRTNAIRINDPSVSRKHLMFYRKGGLVYAENLSHVNGTKVNGRYLTQPREIMNGDYLELGRMKLLVEID